MKPITKYLVLALVLVCAGCSEATAPELPCRDVVFKNDLPDSPLPTITLVVCGP